MKERINGNLVNLSTATKEELDNMTAHTIARAETVKNDLFLLNDYTVRRFGAIAFEQPFEDVSQYEFELSLLDD